MNYDFFKEKYPQITTLYYDYINKSESFDNPVINFVEPATNALIEKAFNEMKCGKEFAALDTLTESQVLYQQSGFILGFTFAMNFMQESLADKVHTFATVNS